MRTLQFRLCVAMCALGAMAGCATTHCSEKRGPKRSVTREDVSRVPRDVGPADIRLWAFATIDARKETESWYDLRRDVPGGVPLQPYFKLPFVRESWVHIEQSVDGQERSFCVLSGPDWKSGAPPHVYLAASIGRAYLSLGWIVLIGSFPTGETGTTQTSADGSRVAIWVDDGTPQRDWIYNFSTRRRHACVKVKQTGEVVSVPPGHYLVVPPLSGGTLEPKPTPTGDAFLKHVGGRMPPRFYEECPEP